MNPEIDVELDNNEIEIEFELYPKGPKGEDGFSPIIRTIETTDGYDIEITDINGTRTITVLNGKDGTNGQDGKDGINGQDGKDGLNGQDGKDGAKGEKGDPGSPGATGNGIASIVKTDTSGLIDTYTITFTDGTSTTFQITNGQNGQPGADGKDGKDGENGTNGVDGQDGQDGYTPVRGTDYWTTQDISTIEQYCANYIDTHITDAIGGAY